jgi:PKD repeat protein
MRKSLLGFVLTLSMFASFSQEMKPCGTTEMYNMSLEQIKKDPALYQEFLAQKQKLTEHTKNFKKSGTERSAPLVIPVVFHIIHDFGPENISDEQVRDAVRIINEDFQKMNSDTSFVVPAFKELIGNPNIEFRLAQIDPNGNPTNGIVRVASEETYRGINNMWQGPFLSNLSRWPREKYLNAWIVAKIESGAAGYSNYPGVFQFQPLVDGMVMLHNYTGSIGTGSPERSRTFTHEAGHWLNLMHVWGNSNNPGQASNCDSDDEVDDTPLSIGWRSCSLSGTSCGSLDNVQNFMEYSYCSRMFTIGQADRLQAALNSPVADRNRLWQDTNLVATGTNGNDILFKADFSANTYQTCEGKSIIFSDNSSNGPSSWSWTFEGGNPQTSEERNPSIIYSESGLYSISLTSANQSGAKTITKTDAVTVLSNKGKPMPAIERFGGVTSFPNENWFVENPDNGTTWTIADVGTNDNRSIYINNLQNKTGRKDEFISTTYDLTQLQEINISFKVAFAQRGNSNDGLSFYISNDCGQTWLFRWKRAGVHLSSAAAIESAFIPNQDEWREFVFTNIPVSHRVENFRFKFEFESQQGNNIYIDDIMIYDPATVNINEIKPSEGFVVYPNPADDKTTVAFSVKTTSVIKLSLIDVLGKEINLISEKDAQAGEHSLSIDKRELNLSSGVYFVKLSVNGSISTRKLILK